MFVAHVPAGYLLARVVSRFVTQVPLSKALTIAIVAGSVAPDVDLLWFYFVDDRQHWHHGYFTHWPVTWLLLLLVAVAAGRAGWRTVAMIRVVGSAAGCLLHIVLDSVAGGIEWLAPWRDDSFVLWPVHARHPVWWMNFLRHPSFLLEVVITASAAVLFLRARPGHEGIPRWRRTGLAVSVCLLVALLWGVWPESPLVPVAGAGVRDWNPRSFWHGNWGQSGVHKGIDIFAPRGRAVLSPTSGVVLFRGVLGAGGNVMVVLGPRWRVHYLAHLDSTDRGMLSLVTRGDAIATVGTSGNAAGKPPHLHYAVISIVPLPWRATGGEEGWRRMFYLDPGMLIAPQQIHSG